MKVVQRGHSVERTIEVGDTIVCGGVRAKVKEMFYSFDGGEGDLMCEFTDTNGVHRYWKQQFDGGYVDPRQAV